MLKRYFFVLILIASFGLQGRVQAAPQDHSDAVSKIQYLLAIDRLDFYSENLADFLDGKKSPDLILALRSLKPEDFYRQNTSLQELANPKAWQQLIFNALEQKNPSLNVDIAELEWNYDFFKNKLAQRFGVKEGSSPKIGYELESKPEIESERSVPHVRGGKILLDTERYIAEKTSRAIFWDAILRNRDFIFFVGTQTDFQEQLHKTKLELVTEVQPMARNYNKIYLMYNPANGQYSYAMNLISGDDRIKHLSAQLRLIHFDGKSFFQNGKDKIKIYGSAKDFHTRQEKVLTDLFSRLPVADKIVIGQKGAIDDVIKNAGMMDVISKSGPQVINGLQLAKSKASKFENLLESANKISSFTQDSVAPGSMIDKAYELSNDPLSRIYKQFDSEQASHDFTDYLLQDNKGQIQRWRVFSAVWGDEIIPIARALKNTGHKDVVYIGTAGAIANKGLKVGDVIAGDHVYTHSGKTLKFSEGKLVKGERPYGVGQVHTPFDETEKWLATEGQRIDAVEVETGYLREHLGADVKLEAYFLISDVVGSESETLAHAAQSSSKRKRGQLKLLENLFVQNGIVAPISNYDLLTGNKNLRVTYNKLKTLRGSREELSLMQVAQVAVRQGKTTDADFDALLKSQPAFTRNDLSNAILGLGGLVAEIQNSMGDRGIVGVVSEALFSGTFNPKVKANVALVITGCNSEKDVIAKIGKNNWSRFTKTLSKYFTIEIVSQSDNRVALAKHFKVREPQDFYRQYENMVLKPAGMASEVDQNGSFRARSLPGVEGAARIRCEAVL